MIKVEKQWLTGEVFGGVVCRRVATAPNGLAVKRSFESVPRAQAPNGVLHTTEGHWGPSMDVFSSRTGTPTFMVGWNTIKSNNVKATGPMRIAQMMPLGEMALTLQNDSGGTETNREALVQIEVIAFSKKEPWIFDAATKRCLASLLDRLEEVCGIPLQRAGNGSRSLSLWDGKAGWFGHGEVPENGHWDPGNLKWQELFGAAPHETDIFWEIRGGGELIHAERAGGTDEADAYDRLITWVDNHEAAVRASERENGHVRMMNAVRPIR